jgi:hypothetical protein
MPSRVILGADSKGLGYGKIKSDFHTPRQSSSNYPYLEPDKYADDEEVDLALANDELDKFVKKVNLGYLPNDFYRSSSKDPFYFTGGNHTLHELDSATVLPNNKSRVGQATGIAPIAQGSSISGYRTRTRPTGTTRGFSSAPAPIASIEDLSGPAYELKDILTPEENGLKDLRALVAAIHAEQESVSG